jgi:hypothetical protein
MDVSSPFADVKQISVQNKPLGGKVIVSFFIQRGHFIQQIHTKNKTKLTREKRKPTRNLTTYLIIIEKHGAVLLLLKHTVEISNIESTL